MTLNQKELELVALILKEVRHAVTLETDHRDNLSPYRLATLLETKAMRYSERAAALATKFDPSGLTELPLPSAHVKDFVSDGFLVEKQEPNTED